jgi:hypothetical protein
MHCSIGKYVKSTKREESTFRCNHVQGFRDSVSRDLVSLVFSHRVVLSGQARSQSPCLSTSSTATSGWPPSRGWPSWWSSSPSTRSCLPGANFLNSLLNRNKLECLSPERLSSLKNGAYPPPPMDHFTLSHSADIVLTSNYKTMAKKLVRDKHSSLFCIALLIKDFYNTDA